ncbi:indolepyruvate oxidoreductase subunit beta [Candidatus Fermentibacteria bacterium]|nr:indolepyruvate oxidoreductase subunit beta [Candidatus Fermentibacteria bacterium]
MTATTNIRLATVGGQGGILASSVIAQTAFDARFVVKKREVHGMSQRGGVVTSDVRFGATVHSPMVPEGAVDILLGFEQGEALRAVHDLKPEGIVIVNTQIIVPPIVATGKASYPENPLEALRRSVARVYALDALRLAEEAGSAKAVSTVMVGALSAFLDFPEDAWLTAIRSKVPPKTIAVNERAFAAGRAAMEPA